MVSIQYIFGKILEYVLVIFFERVEVKGRDNVDKLKGGPVILAVNHPNMLLDPVLATLCSGRESFSFWAKSTLFKGVSGTILSVLGAVPVKRRKDFKEGQKIDNALMFESSVDTLQKGKALLLCPEGVSYTDSHLQEIKTGCARVAQAYFDTLGENVPIIPVGLSYIAKHKWRSNVLVEYGAPVYLDLALKSEDEEEKKEQVRELTRRIEAGMQAVTLNAPDWESMLDLRLARRIYVDGRKLDVKTYVGVQKRFNQFYASHIEEDEIIQVKNDLRSYRKELGSLGLHDWQVSQRFEDKKFLRSYLLSKLYRIVLTLPFAILGLLVHLPVFFLARRMNDKKDTEERAQGKLLTLFFVLPLWYLVLLLGLYFVVSSFWFGALAVALPAFGYVQITFIQQERHNFAALLGLAWLALLQKNSSSKIEQLREDREKLSKAVGRLASRYLAEQNLTPLLERVGTRDDLTKTMDILE